MEIPALIIQFIVLIIAITVHEFAHAFTADRFGDPTPRLDGRLTLNPLSHLDPLGTIMIFLVGFGWGKPVQFDPYNLERPRRDAAIISLAGPASNFVIAIFIAVIMRILTLSGIEMLAPGTNLISQFFSGLLESLVFFNIVLGVFNLIPVHPLDGFKIVEGILPSEQAREWQSLERYGFIILLILVFPIFSNPAPISRIISPVIRTFYKLLLPV